MDKETVLTLKQEIHYFKQPESKPTVLVVTKRKKAGLNVVFCKELGSNSKRLYTLDKLELIQKKTKEIMNDYDIAPEDESEYKGSDSFDFGYLDQNLRFTIEFTNEPNSIEGKIRVDIDSVQIVKVEVLLNILETEVKQDISVVFLQLTEQDCLKTELEEQIEKLFVGTTYELY